MEICYTKFCPEDLLYLLGFHIWCNLVKIRGDLLYKILSWRLVILVRFLIWCNSPRQEKKDNKTNLPILMHSCFHPPFQVREEIDCAQMVSAR